MDDEDQGLADFSPPFQLFEPAGFAHPVVLNSPHSGAEYPKRFLSASALDPVMLRRSEDAYVDQLFAPAAAIGAPLLSARFPRAYLDLNREPYELDPKMFLGRLPDFANTRSLRVAAGLGVIPRVVGEAQSIYRTPFSVEAALLRIACLHRPYHQKLRELLDSAHERFGFSLLIDCHSMPSSTPDVGACDVVLGDRYGSSAARWIVDALERKLRAAGLVVRRNKPYAGGYITEHYGMPEAGRHAVQIEINRSLYMDESTIELTELAFPLAQALATAVGELCMTVQEALKTCWAAE